MELHTYGAKLWFDDNKLGEYYGELVPLALLRVVAHRFDVLHDMGIYGALTHWGVPPCYGQKQLILRNGRASLFSTDELFRLHGDYECLEGARSMAAPPDAAYLRALPGKGLLGNFASALARLAHQRFALARKVRCGSLQGYSERPEHALAMALNPVIGGGALFPVAGFVLFCSQPILPGTSSLAYHNPRRRLVQCSH